MSENLRTLELGLDKMEDKTNPIKLH